MSPINWNDSRGNIGGYRRHVLVSSFVYDLPFGAGKMLLRNAQGFANGAVSGWQVSGVISGMSGRPSRRASRRRWWVRSVGVRASFRASRSTRMSER